MLDSNSLQDNGCSLITTTLTTLRLSHLCAGITIPGLEISQVALILSCAHLTGWSAEKISNQFRERFPGATRVAPETLWHAHWKWQHVCSRASVKEIRQNVNDMLGILSHYTIQPVFDRKKLSETPRPVSPIH